MQIDWLCDSANALNSAADVDAARRLLSESEHGVKANRMFQRALGLNIVKTKGFSHGRMRTLPGDRY